MAFPNTSSRSHRQKSAPQSVVEISPNAIVHKSSTMTNNSASLSTSSSPGGGTCSSSGRTGSPSIKILRHTQSFDTEGLRYRDAMTMAEYKDAAMLERIQTGRRRNSQLASSASDTPPSSVANGSSSIINVHDQPTLWDALRRQQDLEKQARRTMDDNNDTATTAVWLLPPTRTHQAPRLLPHDTPFLLHEHGGSSSQVSSDEQEDDDNKCEEEDDDDHCYADEGVFELDLA